MSQDRWERFRRAFQALSRRDVEAALEEVAPNIEWVDPPEQLEGRQPIRGREALKLVWLENVEPFETLAFEPQEFRDSGNRTFVALRLVGTGKESGAPVEMTWYQVGFFGTDGRFVRLENYFDREQALEAAGLSE